MALVTLTTDFGATDPFVGIMKGVLAMRAPAARVIDLTHGIPPQNVLAGALVLRQALPYFPPGTIHVAVVDPGVGGPRLPLCAETARGLFVGPDNGLLSLAAPRGEVRRVVHLAEERFFLSPRSATFHGRDVFAPVAAALATGTNPGALGPEVTDMVRLELPEPRREGDAIVGQIIYTDHFGNLVTNVPETLLAGRPRTRLRVAVGAARPAPLAVTYADVAPGEPVALIGSWGLIEIAVRDGSARGVLGARVGDPVRVEAG